LLAQDVENPALNRYKSELKCRGSGCRVPAPLQFSRADKVSEHVHLTGAGRPAGRGDRRLLPAHLDRVRVAGGAHLLRDHAACEQVVQHDPVGVHGGLGEFTAADHPAGLRSGLLGVPVRAAAHVAHLPLRPDHRPPQGPHAAQSPAQHALHQPASPLARDAQVRPLPSTLTFPAPPFSSNRV